MNNDHPDLERLGPRTVQLLHQIGYYRDQDERAAQQRAEHDKRRQAAAKTLRQRKRK